MNYWRSWVKFNLEPLIASSSHTYIEVLIYSNSNYYYVIIYSASIYVHMQFIL